MNWLSDLFLILLDFTFYYPLVMSIVWVTGAIYYYFYRESRDHRKPDDPPIFEDSLPVSFLIPCHNEAENIIETIQSLLDQDYSEFEIIVINDASTDDTGALLNSVAAENTKIRVIHLQTNQGKAMGLRAGCLAARYELLVCLDGDALLDRHATRWLTRHFIDGPRVGAVTGNPRVRNRATLLGKIQVGEFSSVVGMLKRAQRIYGRVFTVSGVVCAFRKAALHQVGYWGLDVLTEDIDISWRLQLNHWDIRYEPNALCWILMPEKLKGLFQQRLRWSQGGLEVLVNHFKNMFDWRARRMWIVVIELIVSTFWAYSMGFVLLLWLLSQIIDLPPPISAANIPPGWSGVLLGTMCLVQFGVSLAIDSRYETKLGRTYYWMIWYPMVYWIIQVLTSIVALPRALTRPRGRRGIWRSPDRGIRPGMET